MITIDNRKQCSTCKEWKTATNECFSNKKSGPLGLHSQCKQCAYKSGRKWREANPERAKGHIREWKKKNPELVKEHSRKWYKENYRKWQDANPEKKAARNQKRRALKANADGTATAEQIKARFQYHENRCYYCGDNESGLHVEHRIPLSRGGSNWPSNLVPACPSCNLSKHTKTETEFKKIKGPKPLLLNHVF